MGDPYSPIAIGAGISLLSRMLNRGQRTVNRVKNEAQRLDNLNAPESAYGYPVREFFGECKVDGCSLIWAKPLKEIISTTTSTNVQRAGGGKGGAGGSTTTITETEVANYYMTAAFLIGGPIAHLDRVWANGVSIFELGNSNQWTDTFYDKVQIFAGRSTDDRSSVIGGDSPAFRDCSYIVFNDYPIELYRGSGFPKIDVRVRGFHFNETTERLDLEATIRRIFQLAGVPDNLIVWNATPRVVMYGATFENTGETYAAFIEDLCTIHQIDYYELGGKIYFQDRLDPNWTHFIPLGDLSARNYGEDLSDGYKRMRSDPISMPSDVTIDFGSRTKELARVTCNYRDPSALHYNSVRIGTRIVTNEYDMINAAARLLYQSKHETHLIEELYLMPYWGYLRVGDFFCIYEKETCRVFRVTEVIIADDYRVRVKGIGTPTIAIVPSPTQPDIQPGFSNFFAAEVPVTEIAVAWPPEAQPGVGTATLVPLDIPLLNDDDPDYSIYVAVFGDSTWRGGTIYMSTDSGASYDAVGGLARNTIKAKLGSVPPDIQQSNQNDNTYVTNQSFTIYDTTGQLSSVTQEKFDDYLGLFFLVNNEIIMARDATLTGTGEYTISHLRRGVRGTEWAMTGHSVNDEVIVLSSPLLRVTGNQFLIGKNIRFKAVGQNGSETTVVTYYEIASYQATSMKPYFPVLIDVKQDQGGNLLISWSRRDRRAGFDYTYTGLPLSENSESYDVEIVGGRTVTVDLPRLTYTSSEQIEDFGSVQSTVGVNIWQNSTLVGRGYVGMNIDVTPVFSLKDPVITSFSPTQGDIGTKVVLFGEGFIGATAGFIGDQELLNFTVVDDNTATGFIPQDGKTGKLSLVVGGVGATSLTDFAVVDITGAYPYVAFTAATGSSTARHSILELNINTISVPLNRMSFVRDAVYNSGAGRIDLTPILTDRAGGASAPYQINAAEDFSVYFKYEIEIGTRADGFAFVLTPNYPGFISSITKNAFGQFMGYGNLYPFIAVEFDIYYNDPALDEVPVEPTDPNDNHITLAAPGPGGTITSLSTIENPLGIDLVGTRYVWVDYINGYLQVYLSTSSTKPGSPIINSEVELRTLLSSGVGASVIQSNAAYVDSVVGSQTINLSGSVFLETVSDDTVIKIPAAQDYTILSLKKVAVDSGSCTVAVKINGVAVTGLEAVNVTTVPQTITVVGANNVLDGDLLTWEFSNTSNAENFRGTLYVSV